MAQKRMFDKTITNSDAFLELPDSSQVLYFHLSMNADDDGFVNNWKSILRMTGTKEDDLKILISKQFVIPFESGVVVIKHWRINNYLRNDRHKETTFKDEFAKLSINENEEYVINENFGIPMVYPDKNRIDKNRIDNNIYSQEENKNDITIKLIVDYLNSKAMTNYRATSQTTKKHINARLKEGFKFDDFVIVIDNKTNEWMKTDMEKYLRPETLFGTKFESYLNQKDSSKPAWFDKKQTASEMTSDEKNKMDAIMEKYK